MRFLRIHKLLPWMLGLLTLGICGATAHLIQENRTLQAVQDSPTLASYSNASWKTADLVLFYLPGCPACHQADALLSKVERRHPELNVSRVDTSKEEGKQLQEAACRQLNVPDIEVHLVPAILTKQGSFIADPERILSLLSNWLPPEDRPQGIVPWKPCSDAKGGCNDRF
jgi:glutaredoxin